MIKEIKYNGYTEVPSDYECSDGDLALSQGALIEDGAIKPVLPAKSWATLPAGYSIIFIHATEQIKHYIVRKNGEGKFYWVDGATIDNGTHPVNLSTASFTSNVVWSYTGSFTFRDINAVGNTLMIIYQGGIEYILWKEGSYTPLGTHIPELPITFALQAGIERTDIYERSFSPAIPMPADSDWDEDDQLTISNEVMGKVNNFIQEKINATGKFMYPFLVRYAYRLYDQSLTMHSAPVLMVCSTNSAPLVGYRATGENDSMNNLKYRIFAAAHTLCFSVLSRYGSMISDLQLWSDIVKSVDVFVSAPIYTYNQAGKIKRFNAYDSTSYCIARYNGNADKLDISTLYRTIYSDDTITTRTLDLPRIEPGAIKDKISACHDFYLLSSIAVQSLTYGDWQMLNVGADYLNSLQAREVMTDDYDSHDKLLPTFTHVYNSRLNVANLKKELFAGFELTEMSSPIMNGYTARWNCRIHIRQGGREIIVAAPTCNAGSNSWPLMIYYPNSHAYKAVLECTYEYTPSGSLVPILITTYKEFPLQPHDFLNGVFYFNGWDNTGGTQVYTFPDPSSDRTVNLPNVVYTSEVNNPFLFPSTGVNTVGAGEVLGVAAAAKALSQGQFGQFPLYIFTKEGVWAMELQSDGVFVARQPVTRDVVVNSASITSLDSSVLFATARGIMLLSGSNSKCITDELDTNNVFNLVSGGYPGSAAVITLADIPQDAIQPLDIKTFVKTCRMLYDYTYQRILAYVPNNVCVLVYSLKSGKWGMLKASITSGINSYPEALAMTMQDTVTVLSNFSDLDKTATVKGLIITRPLKLDYPNSLKTIRAVVQRGKFVKYRVKSVLWGSRDMIHWYVVGSSSDYYLAGISGTPYKYFRIGLLLSLKDGESVYGCSIEYDLKNVNKIR